MLDVDEAEKVLSVAPHPGGIVPRFEPSSGEPAHDRLLAEMRAVYLDNDVPEYLDKAAQELLAEGRDTFRALDLERCSIIQEQLTAAVTWLVIKFLAVLAGILMAQAIAAVYAAPYLHPADLPKKLLQSIMMISLSFVIAGIFYFTYEYRFKRLLVTIRRPFKPLTRCMASYAASAEARAAKKMRYAWLRKRARKLASGVLWN